MRLSLSLVLPCLFVAGCNKPAPQAPQLVTKYTLDRSRKGDTPPFEVATRDKRMAIMVWSSDCELCTPQLANLNALAATGKYRVVALDVDVMKTANQPDKLTPYLAANGFKAITPVIVPESSVDQSSRAYHGLDEPIPGMIYYYDSKSAEQWKMKGTADFQSADVQKLLAEGE